MELKVFTAYGVVSSVYHCNKGEGLLPHGHPPGVTHGHIVIAGSVRLGIAGEPERIVDPLNGYIELPADKMHSLIAAQDGTIFINPMREKYAAVGAAPPAPRENLVLMRDIPEG